MFYFPEKAHSSKNEKQERYGWILYTIEESIRNREYIQLYKTHGKEKGMQIELVIYVPVLNWDGQVLQNLQKILVREQPEFVINRTRDYRLALQLESLGLRVFNNAQVSELGNDKAKAYQFMEQHNIPILKTWYLVSDDNASFAHLAKDFEKYYPLIIKSCQGHGGSEVFLIQDESQFEQWKQTETRNYLIQQAATDLGKDVRVYVIGNRIVKAVLRISKNDFRSNFCLGGQAVLYELNEKELELVEQILSLLKIDFAGIDFVFERGKIIFNEIEDMVGARMLYSLTNYDIVEEYVGYIWGVMKNGNFQYGK